MKLPKPTKEHEALDRLAGTWEGDETWSPSKLAPKGATGQGKFDFRRDVDGFFLIADYDETVDGKPGIRGHGVVGWDGKKETYTLHWFDNFGSPPSAPGTGDWDGDTLAFENGTGDHRGRTTFALEGDDAMRFGIEMSEDGGKSWNPTIDGRYRRC
jgi:hypothetical protein